VYHAAALGIVLRTDEHGSLQQSFYQGHTDDVLALALHPGGGLVATGQIGKASLCSQECVQYLMARTNDVRSGAHWRCHTLYANLTCSFAPVL
jgi:hypothetical protein